MSLTSGMNLEASATGKDTVELQKAPLAKRLIAAPISLAIAEAGAQAGIFFENQLASFFYAKDKKGKRDSGWRTKTLLGKVFLAVLVYPVSAPLALGVAASGGVLHLLLGMPTFAECEDQAKRRQRQLLKRGDKPLGRFTHLGPKDLAIPERTEGTDGDKGRDEDEADEPAQEDAEGNLAAKLTDPDVLNAYSRAAELAWERLVQQGHIPPNVRPVINDAMVREVESLVRDAQKQKAG